MPIERRLSTRGQANPVVYIRYRNRCVRPAVGSNISEHGMFLRSREFRFAPGTLIHLEFGNGGEERLIPALVVHSSETGTGVTFLESQSEIAAAMDPSWPSGAAA